MSTRFVLFQGAKYYFYLPIFLLLCFNSIVFLITILSLWKGYRNNEAASSNRAALALVNMCLMFVVKKMLCLTISINIFKIETSFGKHNNLLKVTICLIQTETVKAITTVPDIIMIHFFGPN